MKNQLQRYFANIILVSSIVFTNACENLQSTSLLSADATIPLLPISLPIFPTDLTLDGLTSSLKARVKSLISPLAASLLQLTILDSATSTLQGQFILKPGEELDVSLANVPHLVSMLNDTSSFGQTSKCPSPEQLIGWRLNIKKLELKISAAANFDIPEVPSCRDIASKNNFSYLASACP